MDAIGLEPADRERLAQLCCEEGATTQEEQLRLKAEASELEQLVQSLLPAAIDQTLKVGA